MSPLLSQTSPASLDGPRALRRYAATGDPRAFERLVGEYQSMVLATCLRTLGSRDDAEDAAQETFLKLARHARTVRSNAAAWLHACAVRTSIDLLRSRASRARAERTAAELAATPSAEPTWAELRPALDAALDRLNDADRDLIVTRFLMSRPEIEMARAAGVSAGTMNRRIDRSLGHLRESLGISGLCFASPAVLAAALSPASGEVGVTAATTASLMKIGLAGMSAGGAPATLSSLKVAVVCGACLSVAAVIGVGLALRGEPAPAPPASSTAVFADAAKRPITDQGPLPLARSLIDGLPTHEATCAGDSFVVRSAVPVPPGSPPKVGVLRLKIDSADLSARPPTIALKILATDMPGPNPFSDMIGQTMSGTCEVADDRMHIHLDFGEPRELAPGKWTGGTMDWRAVRIPAPLFAPGEAPGGPPATDSTPAPFPALVGSWAGLDEWSLRASTDELAVFQGELELFRYRILDWRADASGGFARVQALCARNLPEPSLIGSRVKLLVRVEPDGYTLAVHTADSGKAKEAPAGFETKRGDGVRVMTFRKPAR